ncbi:MAG: exo-alpha-sialidase, partial [Thermoguttaceae bacterium]|nr:exo-alpha-sialidase [Thermoguttaceae bacterium]
MGRTCFALFAIGYLALIYSLGSFGVAPADQSQAALPPQIAKSVVLELPPGEDNPRNSEGDFIRLESGDILYVYTHYYGASGDDHATARLCSRITKNYGATWSEEDEVILDNEGQLNVMSVSLLRLRDRSIALFYLVKESAGDCRPYLRYSYDEGETWTDRVQILPEASYNVINNSRAV